MIRVVIADDHDVLRWGLVWVLDAEPDVEVVGEASDGVQAVEVVRSRRPDVLLLDLSMPGGGGFPVLASVHEEQPDLPVIVLSASDDDQTVRSVRAAGAADFVSKASPPEVLLDALRVAAVPRSEAADGERAQPA
jgi:DNA-binding NarL/FixJ family response regulator